MLAVQPQGNKPCPATYMDPLALPTEKIWNWYGSPSSAVVMLLVDQRILYVDGGSARYEASNARSTRKAQGLNPAGAVRM